MSVLYIDKMHLCLVKEHHNIYIYKYKYKYKQVDVITIPIEVTLLGIVTDLRSEHP